jgi:hypothetical protein
MAEALERDRPIDRVAELRPNDRPTDRLRLGRAIDARRLARLRLERPMERRLDREMECRPDDRLTRLPTLRPDPREERCASACGTVASDINSTQNAIQIFRPN